MICAICGTTDSPDWHNAEPVAHGKCCESCHGIVLKRRLEDVLKVKLPEQVKI